MFTKFFSRFSATSAKGASQGRQFWTGLTRAGYYDKSSNFILTSHYFDKSTIRGGKSIYEEGGLLSFLFNAYPNNFVYRGMLLEETKDPINHKLWGLVGKQPLVVINDQKQIDEAQTKEKLRLHQRGDIHGISTTQSVGTSLEYSSYLGKNQGVMLFDLNNIPKHQRYIQIYDPNQSDINTQGEGSNFKSEKEITVSSLHISAILCRVTRTGLTSINYEANPFYVDRMILTPELTRLHDELLQSFYDVVQTVYVRGEKRTNPNPALYQDYLFKQTDFYRKMAAANLIDSKMMARIEEGLAVEDSENSLKLKL